MSSMQAAEEAQRVATEIHEHHRAAAALDPLLATLANFKSPQHLSMQLEVLFTLFDRDDGGAVHAHTCHTLRHTLTHTLSHRS